MGTAAPKLLRFTSLGPEVQAVARGVDSIDRPIKYRLPTIHIPICPFEKMSPNSSNGPGSPLLSWDDVQGHLWLSRPDVDSHTESNIATLLSASSYPLPERNGFSATASSVKKRGRPLKDFDGVETLDSKEVGVSNLFIILQADSQSDVGYKCAAHKGHINYGERQTFPV